MTTGHAWRRRVAGHRRWGAAVAVLLLAATATMAQETRPAAPTTQPVRGEGVEGQVVVGKLVYGKGKTSLCFAEGFLAAVARETQIKVHRKLVAVELGSPDLFRYPFVVMTGEGAFELSDAERQNLRSYLGRGGMVLASAGCTSTAWAASFRKELALAMPGGKLEPLPMSHGVFHRVYEIQRVLARKEAGEALIYGLEVGGRLALIYSPVGLNDTANAGAGCCCCGGNEIRNAQQINANALVYALTR